jgi:uncharacterized protein involved in exopolysaccharide biosynthesis
MSTEARENASRTRGSFNPVLASLLQAAARRRRLVPIAALTIVLLSAVTAALLPNFYTASVVILPPQGSSSGTAMLAQLSNLSMLGSMGGGMGIKNPNDMQVSLLKSRTVEDAMVERFHLQTEYGKRTVSAARKRWERKTAIDNGLKDGLIRISVTDRDPRRAAELAGGWLEEYRRLTATLAVTEAAQRRLFFERELSGARDDLTRAENNLKDTEQRTGVMEIDGQARALIASAAMLRAQAAEKQVEIGAMRQFAASGNPDLTRAEQELNGLESQLAEMDLDSDHAAGDLVSPKGRITQAGLDYTRALREVKYREAMVEVFTRQYEVARIDEARQGSPIQIVDPAIPPDRPNSRYRLWIFFGGVVLALPLGLGIAWMAEGIAAARGLRRRYGSWAAALEQSLALEAR